MKQVAVRSDGYLREDLQLDWTGVSLKGVGSNTVQAGEEGGQHEGTSGAGERGVDPRDTWRQSYLDWARDWPCTLGKGRGREAPGLWAAGRRW